MCTRFLMLWLTFFKISLLSNIKLNLQAVRNEESHSFGQSASSDRAARSLKILLTKLTLHSTN